MRFDSFMLLRRATPPQAAEARTSAKRRRRPDDATHTVTAAGVHRKMTANHLLDHSRRTGSSSDSLHNVPATAQDS